MGKRIWVCVMGLFLMLPLCGCWNYRGLDQLDIVVGIAIDFDKETNKYKLSYEVADLAEADKKSSINGIIVEAEGNTIFDAARNAKRREADRLFFGSAYIVVISQELAREEGIAPIIEWFLRDAECRETMYVVLSQKETAKEILESSEDGKGIVSVRLQDIISEDNEITASSSSKMLYEIFDTIESPRRSVMLPALNKIQNGDKEIWEINGIAVCKEDKLAGFLSPEESKYALFVEDELKGGILTLSMAGMRTDDISLEISGNKTKKSFSYEQGKVKIRIETDTRVAIAENLARLDVMDVELVKRIEETAARMIEKNAADLIARIQGEFNADLFGFGEMIYKRDLRLWRQLEPSWDVLFPTLEVVVSSKVRVINSAFIR